MQLQPSDVAVNVKDCPPVAPVPEAWCHAYYYELNQRVRFMPLLLLILSGKFLIANETFMIRAIDFHIYRVFNPWKANIKIKFRSASPSRVVLLMSLLTVFVHHPKQKDSVWELWQTLIEILELWMLDVRLVKI